MIYGYINTMVKMPQLSEEMLQDEAFKMRLKDFKDIPEPFIIDNYCIKKKNSRAHLMQTSPDKSLLTTISDITKEKNSDLHFLDRIENKLIENAAPGDIVLTSTLLNFSRYLDQALKVVRFYYEKKVRVIALLEKFDSFAENTLMGSTIYFDFQTSRALEQRNARKSKGKQDIDEKIKDPLTKSGRKKIKVSDFPFFDQYFRKWDNGGITKTEFAEKLGISKATLTRLIDEYVTENYSAERSIS